MTPESIQKARAMIKVAMADLDKNWERCDKESGRECRGPICEYVEHRVMVMLCDIDNELAK